MVSLLTVVVAGCSDGQARDQVPPQIIPRYDTPSANYNHASSVVFPEHDGPLGTDTGGEYIA